MNDNLQNWNGRETDRCSSLRAWELSYRRLFEAAQEGILILDLETGRINEVNPFLVKLLGFSEFEMVGKTVGELSPFKDILSNQAMLKRLQQDGDIRYENLPLQTKHGREIAVEYISKVYHAGDGSVIQCNIRDITERLQAEAALVRLGAIVEASDDAIIGKDLDGIITSWNKGAKKIFGYTAEEMVGTSIMRLIPADRPEEEEQILDQVKRGQSVEHFETVRVARDGRLINVLVTASPITNAAGRVTGVSKVAHDITERKGVESVLRASESRYRNLYNSIDVGFCVIEMLFDTNGAPDDYRFLETNPAFEKQTGMREVLGKRMRELVPDHDQSWFETYGRVALTGEAIRFEKKAEAMNRWFDVYAFRLDDSAIQNVAILFTDITERKAEEKKNSDLNLWLEQRVAERTAQLKTANNELEAFSYSVSHDLRAPLRHIMGFVNLLQKDTASSLSDKNIKHLKTISDSAKRMGDLIDDLLDFSRVGRAVLNKTSVQLDQLVQETLDDFREETKDRKIIWEIWPLPTVCADRALLRLVLVNLISNALKFTGQREVAKIEIVSAPNKNGETVIFIRDNGAGFDPSYAHKLFGVFQRLHSHAEFEGTGIGLANIQRIIHRHGGRVWAEGGMDAGATFYFSIPKAINGDIHGH